VLRKSVQFKSVEGDSLFSDADFNKIGPHIGVKAIAVHTQVTGRIAEAD
jgi:hypothetical protein